MRPFCPLTGLCVNVFRYSYLDKRQSWNYTQVEGRVPFLVRHLSQPLPDLLLPHLPRMPCFHLNLVPLLLRQVLRLFFARYLVMLPLGAGERRCLQLSLIFDKTD